MPSQAMQDYPESLLITPNGARRKAPPNENCHNDGRSP